MECVIVDYGSGNIRSAFRALSHVADTHHIVLSSDPKVIAKADHLVLPGVGAFGSCKKGLLSREGVIEAMHVHVQKNQRPFLGICVGMQLLADYGEEFSGHAGLGWVPGRVKPFSKALSSGLCIPQMGWNRLRKLRENALMSGLPDDSMVYFVHGFVFHATQAEHIVAEAEYGETFTAIIGKDNVMGTQFHPEKSQHVGLAILQNFLQWRP